MKIVPKTCGLLHLFRILLPQGTSRAKAYRNDNGSIPTPIYSSLWLVEDQCISPLSTSKPRDFVVFQLFRHVAAVMGLHTAQGG